MLTFELGNIVRIQNGRTIPITKVSEFDRFRALRNMGISETVASAVVRGLIVLPARRVS